MKICYCNVTPVHVLSTPQNNKHYTACLALFISLTNLVGYIDLIRIYLLMHIIIKSIVGYRNWFAFYYYELVKSLILQITLFIVVLNTVL